MEILRRAQSPMHHASGCRIFGSFGNREHLTAWADVIARLELFRDCLSNRFREFFLIGME